ncbi:ABC transporter permease subunit [Streptomyces sp. NPDC003758]|uniref:ABC transporter permease subunit n=1 Tax=Streptomyces cynarae TaxID=2981134 RepID=A0ABY6DZ64_9ACTN|nr:ABC transporter permease subunit [Streptomyces cynarae]UXY19677.1 ABC transporter permease subunit [Streptomyces cynarae]
MTTALALPAARFTDLLAAEWIKLRSLRSTYWALGASGLSVVAFNANAARADYANYPHYNGIMRAHFVDIALRDAFTAGAAMILVLAVAGIGAITVVGEYSTGLIRTTFAAVPDRRALMTAKVVVLTAVMTVFGAVVAGASFAVTQAVLDGRGQGVSISHPGALRVVVASALLAPVCALVGMGLGALIRHSATTMVLTVFVLLLLPTMVTERYHWTACVRNALPFNAWDRLVDIGYGHDPFTLASRYPTTVTGGWIVFAAWSLVAAVVAVVTVDRRDV